ncbi:hypothetical protein CAOG_07885 [Capsaspora owczarzaki ATCC 30864]|uniref:Sugar phosphate phosphatase n=1 Tax=Capsaspora owczarzaki (strain ATCC 30864) TaxID=595528 RepID=A0A0D2US42_CAPO3|nr:hypothetical protein CAOG_07885 [Capsaspora owczarzaki ATCC 30864]KJE97786.1 hypothetical protein CAOG_007885 [Capsaspora owczarzaki ATCC 30864]|eukprot:XP_004342970.1 hypothetical protein CAOG_07885 [Capsaspora owczarzaki ATCC 30864]
MSLPPRVRPSSDLADRSFATLTLRERLPVILTRIISMLSARGAPANEASKALLAEMVALKYDLWHNKPMLPVADDLHDAAKWRAYFAAALEAEAQNGGASAESKSAACWSSLDMLYSEGYLYRRIRSSCLVTEGLLALTPLPNPEPTTTSASHGDDGKPLALPLNLDDVFESDKRTAFAAAQSSILALSSLLTSSLEDLQQPVRRAELLTQQFMQMLEFSLWGNKTDLSLHPSATNKEELLKELQSSELSQLNALRPAILANAASEIWAHIQLLDQQLAPESCVRFDFVLDNAGYELFTDLILAEWLTSAPLFASGRKVDVYFHVKDYGWYVSDVTKRDFHWMVNQLACSTEPVVHALGRRWRDVRLGDATAAGQGKWHIVEHEYWTLPGDYHELPTLASDLYATLQQSNLLIFKGDLNYRRLIGDRLWIPTTPFSTALHTFHPAPLCTLRTLKAEVVAGLAPGVAKRTAEQDAAWLSNGRWALISFDK